MLAGGALLGLMQMLDADPEADAAVLSDQMAARVLCALGLGREEAAELTGRPLPAVRDPH